jgi:hypothetical protein
VLAPLPRSRGAPAAPMSASRWIYPSALAQVCGVLGCRPRCRGACTNACSESTRFTRVRWLAEVLESDMLDCHPAAASAASHLMKHMGMRPLGRRASGDPSTTTLHTLDSLYRMHTTYVRRRRFCGIGQRRLYSELRGFTISHAHYICVAAPLLRYRAIKASEASHPVPNKVSTNVGP